MSEIIEEETLQDTSSFLFKLLQSIGIVLMFIIGTIIGIAFITASATEKAKVKETLVPYVVGCIVIFGAFFIWSTVVNLGQDMFSTQGTINETVEGNDEGNNGYNTDSDGSNTSGSGSNISDNGSNTSGSESNISDNGSNTGGSGSNIGGGNFTTPVIKTDNIVISETSLTLDAPIEKTYQLTAQITPSNSQDKLIWKSSDTNIITVNDGKVNAVGIGTAIITATSGTKSATCTVQVNDISGYSTCYYNLATDTVNDISPQKAVPKQRENMGFWIDIPNVSKVKDVEKIPLVVFFGGIGSRYEKLEGLKDVIGLKKKDYPAIIIQPVLGAWEDNGEEKVEYWAWKTYQQMIGLINHMVENYNVDSNKIALSGFSYGGQAAWELSILQPNMASCLLLIDGGPYYTKEDLKNNKFKSDLGTQTLEYPDCPIWVFAGEDSYDNAMGYANKLVKCYNVTMKERGGNKKQTIQVSDTQRIRRDLYKDLSHTEMQLLVIQDANMIQWMIDREKGENYKFE